MQKVQESELVSDFDLTDVNVLKLAVKILEKAVTFVLRLAFTRKSKYMVNENAARVNILIFDRGNYKA